MPTSHHGAIDPDNLTRAAVAHLVDHTLLKSDATSDQIAALVRQAVDLGAYAVCLSPPFVALAGRVARGLAAVGNCRISIATVAGFPSGKHHPEIKAAEAARAVADGADEIDMVIDVGLALTGEFDRIHAEIMQVRAVVPAPVVLKVIIESAALSDLEIKTAAEVCRSAGADFVKTSTGFHPAGGASVRAVEIIAAAVGGKLGIKASGGIRTAEQATELIRAGATRLGLSGSAEVLAGFPE